MADKEPTVEAQCADCGKVFIVNFGDTCPLCHSTAKVWARVIFIDIPPQVTCSGSARGFSVHGDTNRIGIWDRTTPRREGGDSRQLYRKELPTLITEADRILLHGLGVTWDSRPLPTYETRDPKENL
jgi:RNA polymerase subunit RPABC4/transcription elongation factor Spt4